MREVQEAFRRAFEDAPIGMALFGVDGGGARAPAAGEPLAVRDHRLRGARARGDDARADHAPVRPRRGAAAAGAAAERRDPQLPAREALPARRRQHGVGDVQRLDGPRLRRAACSTGSRRCRTSPGARHSEDRLASVAAELERRATELERSNSDLQEFAYVASHDLSEPLRMVSSYVQLLARRYGGQLDSDADEFIEFAVDGVNRMQRLIDDLLAYSRAGTQEYRIGARRLRGAGARHARRACRRRSPSRARRSSSSDLPTVRGDEGQLRQLFQNLIGNGIKFRDRGAAPRRGLRRARATARGASASRTTASASTRATRSASSPSSSACTRATSTRAAASGCRSASGSSSATGAASGSSRASSGGSRFCFTIPDRQAGHGEPDE